MTAADQATTESLLAIIPARGGSKRIPQKNVRHFLGKPIIEYAITAARSSGIFTETMVSTDDQVIARIAEAAGANVPFLRSSATSNDHAGLAEVCLEVLDAYGEQQRHFDYLCCILPTAPFVSPKLLTTTFQLLRTEKVSSLVPIVRYSYPIERAVRLNKRRRINMVDSRNYALRSQDCQPTFHDSGLFYWITPEHLRQFGRLFGPDSLGYVIPESCAQDIDTLEDWKIAELKYTLLYR